MPVGQVTQVTPPVPHAWLVLPVRQVVPSQQPAQVPGPHRLTQLPLWHCVPLGQLTQVAPLRPQAVSEVPVLQVFPSQQPLGQLVGVHTH